MVFVWVVRWLSGEGVGLVIRGMPDRFPAVQNDIVSLGKALHPTCLGGKCPCAYCKSLWIRASAKCIARAFDCRSRGCRFKICFGENHLLDEYIVTIACYYVVSRDKHLCLSSQLI